MGYIWIGYLAACGLSALLFFKTKGIARPICTSIISIVLIVVTIFSYSKGISSWVLFLDIVCAAPALILALFSLHYYWIVRSNKKELALYRERMRIELLEQLKEMAQDMLNGVDYDAPHLPNALKSRIIQHKGKEISLVEYDWYRSFVKGKIEYGGMVSSFRQVEDMATIATLILWAYNSPIFNTMKMVKSDGIPLHHEGLLRAALLLSTKVETEAEKFILHKMFLQKGRAASLFFQWMNKIGRRISIVKFVKQKLDRAGRRLSEEEFLVELLEVDKFFRAPYVHSYMNTAATETEKTQLWQFIFGIATGSIESLVREKATDILSVIPFSPQDKSHKGLLEIAKQMADVQGIYTLKHINQLIKDDKKLEETQRLVSLQYVGNLLTFVC